MEEMQKIKDKNKKYSSIKEDQFLPEFMNKVIVCETLGGKTITGILTGHDKYTMLLIEAMDIKSKKPMKTLVYKHGVVSIREME